MPIVVELLFNGTNDLYFLSINDKCLEINKEEFEHLKAVFDLYEKFGKFIEENKKEGN